MVRRFLMSDLLLSELRRANLARLPEFKDAQGRVCHPPYCHCKSCRIVIIAADFEDSVKEGRVLCHRCKGELELLPPGYDWSLAHWSNAVCGELGEAANLIKKIERGDFSIDDPGVREELGNELCDVLTYLDILAHRAGINLAEAALRKWNKASERVGSSVRLDGVVPAAFRVP